LKRKILIAMADSSSTTHNMVPTSAWVRLLELIITPVNLGQGGHDYRPNPPGLETEGCTDHPRLAFSPGLQDYNVGFNSGGTWGHFPFRPKAIGRLTLGCL
jgi:hypothetical protein